MGDVDKPWSAFTGPSCLGSRYVPPGVVGNGLWSLGNLPPSEGNHSRPGINQRSEQPTCWMITENNNEIMCVCTHVWGIHKDIPWAWPSGIINIFSPLTILLQKMEKWQLIFTQFTLLFSPKLPLSIIYLSPPIHMFFFGEIFILWCIVLIFLRQENWLIPCYLLIFLLEARKACSKEQVISKSM